VNDDDVSERFPNRAYVVYMQVNEIAKNRKAGGGKLVR